MREKVLAALAACLPETEADAGIGCGGCPYGYCSEGENVNLPTRLIEDVRALLRGEAPRVMSVDEVAALPEGEVVWYEQRIFDGEDYLSPMVKGMGGYIGNGSMGVKIATIDGWERCWSARPSDELRRATPWPWEEVRGHA